MKKQNVSKKNILVTSKNSKYESYIDKDGYNIDKKSLKSDDLSTIKKDLHIQPYIQGDPDVPYIDVYNETNKLITVPRFYGTGNFGAPKKYMLDYKDSDYKFLGQLRDNQKKIMDKTVSHLEKNYGGILSVPCASGKCLAKGTQIIMYDGSTKNVENIMVNDKIMGDDGTPRNILSTTKGYEDMFKIFNNDMDVDYTVNKSHILSLKCKNYVEIDNYVYNNGDIIDISLTEFIELDNHTKQKLCGYRVPIDFTEKFTPIDPYYCGFNSAKLVDLQDRYLYNSSTVRLKLLAGILDKHGIYTKHKRCYSFVNRDNMDCDKFIYLARSLGYVTHSYICDDTMYIDLHGDLTKIPVRLLVDDFIQDKRVSLSYDITVKHMGYGEYYGFEIDGNRRFILGDFTVTHNTVMALYLGNYFKAKTLVVVHKSFLLNQWIERAKQFTDAKIGILQKNVIPDHDCDIVVAMIHSICLKNYDKKVFEGFKLLIIDECILGNQYILTNRGCVTIQKLYELWIENPHNVPFVLSYNNVTNKSEYKNITHAWKKEVTKTCVDIIYGNNRITCTADHLFLTSDGTYKKAIELEHHHYVLSNSLGNIRKYSDDQIQILFGLMLINMNKFKIVDDCIIYENTGKCYDPETIWFIKNMDCSITIHNNGNATYSTGLVYVEGLIDDMGLNIDYVMDNINILAVKYSLYTYGWIGTQLDTTCFKKKIMELLDSQLLDYNICDHRIQNKDKNMTPELLKIKKSNIGYIKVDKILVYKNRTVDVYDLEVQDNHNFVITGKYAKSYGLIAHNCHHYASPVFSKGIQKCGSPYILALSATPYRKDKLTNILMWNFGNIFYREKTKTNKQVVCKIFRFKSKDKLFVEKKQWFRGQMKPSHTKMVNNLVLIKNRNDQIINILNELRKYPERKVLVLSGRKEHLKTLKESVDNSITEDIGKGLLEPMEYRTYYYMGKMKNTYRKEAEDFGDMLFGTYDMAHEGLDIDRLNTIVLATPKKDIVQSVGRVMRKILKTGDLRPLIIDIRDELSIYKKQSDIRIKQYNIGRYKIEDYYLEDSNIVKLENHLKKEFDMSQAHIEEYINNHPEKQYIPKWENILNLQKVEGEGDDDSVEVYEVDPNEIDLSDGEDEDNNYENDSDDDDDNDNDNDNENDNDGKGEISRKKVITKKIITKYKKPDYDGYMF